MNYTSTVAPFGIPVAVPAMNEPRNPSDSAAAATVPQPAPPLPDRIRSEVWDVPFDHLTLAEAVDWIECLVQRRVPSYVITANLNYCMLHHRDPAVGAITDDADLILADGQPIVLRSRLSKAPIPERVAGSEMIYHLAERCSDNGWGIYFLGGEEGVAAQCANKLQTMYPGLKISGVESPPFRQLSEREQHEQDQRIKKSGAAILLVAFGQPKGEKWIHENYKRLGIPVSIQLGASFDFIAGTAKRAPMAWQKIGMEWAYRMCSDPKRLVPRYAKNATFLLGALIEDWKRLVTSWGMGDWSNRPER
ncbi:N-acetylglucosaminyldiphosphoundecaprenol N-acetyl-beta-D-mannosaminyltransferase [Novipirellula caenicola]|uniref:N-acetylglucosaminyldiphosphoundecaprenol N-acetyl-beta-D-mannosaminyltransferase n=2 Tax=Novipirellula caenicola TaxID=1536901 RepID=A0ABP9VZK5_9BACT